MENDLAPIRLSAGSQATHNGVTYSPIAKLDDAAGLYTPNVGNDATVAGWGNWRFSGPDTDGNGWGDNSTEVWEGTGPLRAGVVQIQPDSSVNYLPEHATFNPAKQIAAVGSALVNGAAAMLRRRLGRAAHSIGVEATVSVWFLLARRPRSPWATRLGIRRSAATQTPRVYTRISAYRAWIDTTIAADRPPRPRRTLADHRLLLEPREGQGRGPRGWQHGGRDGGRGESIDSDLEMVAVAAESGRSADDDYAGARSGGRRPPGRSGAAAAGSKCRTTRFTRMAERTINCAAQSRPGLGRHGLLRAHVRVDVGRLRHVPHPEGNSVHDRN